MVENYGRFSHVVKHQIMISFDIISSYPTTLPPLHKLMLLPDCGCWPKQRHAIQVAFSKLILSLKIKFFKPSLIWRKLDIKITHPLIWRDGKKLKFRIWKSAPSHMISKCIHHRAMSFIFVKERISSRELFTQLPKPSPGIKN